MFYSFDNSTGNDVGNVYPQLRCINDDAFRRSFTLNPFVDSGEVLKFEIEKGALETDIMSQSGLSANGLIISQRLKMLLGSFELMNHKYYPVDINGLSASPYYWVSFDHNLVKEIDYEKSKFRETKFSTKKGFVELRSFEHFEELKEKNGKFWSARLEELVLEDQSEVKNLDLFYIFPFDFEFSVSDKLVKELKSQGITGWVSSEDPKIFR